MALETATTSQEALALLSMATPSRPDQPSDIVEISWQEEGVDGAVGDGDDDDVVIESIAVGDGTGNDSIDRGTENPVEAVSLLDTHFRLNVRTDLIELQYFLMQRIDDLRDESFLPVLGGLSLSGSIGSLSWSLDALEEVVSAQSMFDSPQLHRLLKIRSNPIYLDRLVTSFETPSSLERKCIEKAAALRERAEEFVEAADRINQQLRKKVSSTASLKEQTERDLSSIFKGSSIKLVGQIGDVLRRKQT